MKWVSAGSSPSTEHTYMYTVSTQWQYKQYYYGDECVAWGVGAGQRRRGARYTVSQRYDTCFWLGFCQCFAIKGKTSRMSHSFLGFGRSHCHRTNSTLDMSDLIVCLCGLLRAMTWPEQIRHHNSKLHKNNRRKKKHRIISSDDISMSIDFALYAFTHRITITTSEAIHTTILHTKTICKYRHKKIKELGMQSSWNNNKK